MKVPKLYNSAEEVLNAMAEQPAFPLIQQGTEFMLDESCFEPQPTDGLQPWTEFIIRLRNTKLMEEKQSYQGLVDLLQAPTVNQTNFGPRLNDADLIRIRTLVANGVLRVKRCWASDVSPKQEAMIGQIGMQLHPHFVSGLMGLNDQLTDPTQLGRFKLSQFNGEEEGFLFLNAESVCFESIQEGDWVVVDPQGRHFIFDKTCKLTEHDQLVHSDWKFPGQSITLDFGVTESGETGLYRATQTAPKHRMKRIYFPKNHNF